MPSVTVTVYVPADKPVIVAVAGPELHAYEYGAEPPLATTVAVPLLPGLQGILVALHSALNGRKEAKVDEHVAVQLFASFTVTVYVPATNPVAVGVNCPSLHKYV